MLRAELSLAVGFNPEFDGPYALVDAQTGKKTSGPQHHARKLVEKNAAGDYDEVPAKEVQNDSEYTIPVKIGSQEQPMNMDLDTGSSDFWVRTPVLCTTSRFVKLTFRIGVFSKLAGRRPSRPQHFQYHEEYILAADDGLHVEHHLRRRLELKWHRRQGQRDHG